VVYEGDEDSLVSEGEVLFVGVLMVLEARFLREARRANYKINIFISFCMWITFQRIASIGQMVLLIKLAD
jgi:hypothetical protein